jgi:hypothetical protein
MIEILQFATQVLSLSVPILSAGILLILSIKNNWFSILNRPIDFGRNIFGNNKTLRGVLIYPVIATPVTVLMHYTVGDSPWVCGIYREEPFALGLISSLAYVGGELINSFIKRRLKVAAGAETGRIQAFFDNADGMLASGVVMILVYQLDAKYLIASFFVSIAIHAATDAVMRRLGLKQNKK